MNEDLERSNIEFAETPRIFKTESEPDQVTTKLSLSSKPMPKDEELSLHLDLDQIKLETKTEILKENRPPENPESEKLTIQIPSIVTYFLFSE